MSDLCVVDSGAGGPAPPERGSSQRQRAVGAGTQDRRSETCGHGHLKDTNLITEDNRIHTHIHEHITHFTQTIQVCLSVCTTLQLLGQSHKHCPTQASICILQYLLNEHTKYKVTKSGEIIYIKQLTGRAHYFTQHFVLHE